jgi:hypothetical protein
MVGPVRRQEPSHWYHLMTHDTRTISFGPASTISVGDHLVTISVCVSTENKMFSNDFNAWKDGRVV